MLQSFGKNNTIASKLCEEWYYRRKYPTANCSQEHSVQYSSSLCSWPHPQEQILKHVPILRRTPPRLSNLIQNLQCGDTKSSMASWLHSSILTVLCIWRESGLQDVMPLPHWLLQWNGQRFAQVHFEDASPSAFQCCQGNLITFGFAVAHQRLRDRTHKAHVDSKAEAKVLEFHIFFFCTQD